MEDVTAATGRVVMTCLVVLCVAACSMSRPPSPDVSSSSASSEESSTVTAEPLGEFSVLADEPEPIRGTGEVGSPEGRREYLAAVAELLGDEGLLVDPTSWPDHVAAARRGLEAQNTSPVLRREVSDLVQIAGGPHSSFFTPGDWTSPPLLLPEVATRRGVSQVSLPAGGGADVAEITAYATAGLEGIRQVKPTTGCGWIVDVRGNTGGGSWPMLAAVAPLLPDGSLGGFIDREGHHVDVRHERGRLTQDGAFQFDYDARLRVDQPVAVLIDYQSASAAEAVAASFHGQPGTQIIGQRSAGFATGNSLWPLEDGSRLALTISWMVDADGSRFPSGVEPQIVVPPQYGEIEPGRDLTVQAAEDWLRETCD